MPKTNGHVVGIDPGRKTGIGVLGGRAPWSETWTIRVAGEKFNETRDLSILRGNLNALSTSHADLILCVCEGGFHAKGDTQRQHDMMRGVIALWCQDIGIEYVQVPPSTLKKWATGNGKASKGAMVESAKAEVGKTIKTLTEDEADAILCALWGRNYLKKEAG